VLVLFTNAYNSII